MSFKPLSEFTEGAMQLTITQIGLAIAIVAAAILGFMVVQNVTDRADLSYSSLNVEMTKAAVRFAQVQRSAIMTASNACGSCAVKYTAAQMVTAGALDPSYNGTTPTGGTYCLEFRTYNSGANIQGVLTVVGETSPLNQADALIAANSTQANSGYVSGGNVVFQGGSQPLAQFTGAAACNPAANAFAAVITDNQTAGTTAIWLCRQTITGNSSCSTMTIPLNMGGNDILNAMNGYFAGGVSLTGAVPQAGQFLGTTLNVSGAASTGPLTVTGNGSASGTFTAQTFAHTSDGRLKSDWQDIDDPFALLAPIHYGRFRWKDSGFFDYGVEAQSLQETLPELVHVDDRGRYAVNYDGLVPILIAAANENRSEANAARQEAAAARAELQSMRDQLAHMH
jgi:hypothetical protein